MSGGTNLKHQPSIGARALGYRAVQVLGYVRTYQSEHGRAPGIRTIRKALDFYDDAGVLRVVARLERRGLLMRVGNGKVRRGSDWNLPTLKLAP